MISQNQEVNDLDPPDSDSIYIWQTAFNLLIKRMAILEIAIFLMVLSKNLVRLHVAYLQSQNNKERDSNHKKLKYKFLLHLATATVFRILSLIYLMTKPSGLSLYLAYLIPIQIWIPSILSFMGFLGKLYLQLMKINSQFLKTVLDWSVIFLSKFYLFIEAIIVILFFFDSLFNIQYEAIIMNLIKIDMILYTIIQVGNLFFGFSLYKMVSQLIQFKLQDESWILSLLNEFKKIVLTLTFLYIFRMLYFFLIAFQYVDLKNDKILLMEIFTSEVIPYIYLISTKLQLNQFKNEHEEVSDTIEMKDMKESLIVQNY